MTDAVIISDQYRVPITAQRHMDDPGGVVVRTAKSLLVLSSAEVDRLAEFVSVLRNEPRLQRYPVHGSAS